MKLQSIQFLRGIAILLIVYAQSIQLSREVGPSYQQSFYNLSQTGYMGIDLLFVICGFVIAYSAHQARGAQEGLQFLQKRFLRVSPLFYIASILFFGVEWFKYWATDNPNSFLLSTKTIPGLVDTLWIVPTTHTLSHYKLYLSTGWTLAFVWLFYLLFFITIFAHVKRKTIVLASIISTLVLAGYLIKPTDLRLSFATNMLLPEFLLGVLICQLYLKKGTLSKWLPIVFLFGGIAWIIGLVFYQYGNISNSNLILNGSLSLQRLLLWGLPSGLVVAGSVLLEKNKQLQRIWQFPLIQSIGNASYSIYLVHSIVFALFATLYRNINTLLLPDLGIIVQLIAAIITGLLVYRYLEKPFLHRLYKASQPRSIVPTTTQPQSA